MSEPIRVILAGGGTAGHTSPLIATAEQLTATGPVEILCIGTPKGLETRVIPDAGLSLALIPPVPLPRKPSRDLIALPLRLRNAVREAKALLREHRAQVVAGFGGYVSLPVYLAARAEKIPLVIHEGNVVAGLANKVGARFADAVVTSFPDTALPRARQLGLPVRAAIAGLDRDRRRAEARAHFGLPGEGRVVLVSGGSQGARSLNAATTAAIDRLLAAGISILHVVGPANLTEDVVPRDNVATTAVYRPVGYVDDMAQAYSAADVMLGRAGAGTVMETAMIGLPTIFVPLPHGNGEQARNAEFLIRAEAGLMIADADLTADVLVDRLTALLADPQRLRAMSDTCRALVSAGAAQALADLIRTLAEGEE
ncbi:MAG TPA: undecaprenyldiphospho-muramoylpentapeptide beta-N-acetylglucosaminyltransferase [Propionicimonas sp.]|nr:undecaprenyldiphospho-muramoylpentapeptide beta-N-acetylglucosaminyltransferase [Propionicimonas sp.]